jgi:hypothetical protein
MERFNIKKLSQIEGLRQYQDEISKKLTALENLDAEDDIN